MNGWAAFINGMSGGYNTGMGWKAKQAEMELRQKLAEREDMRFAREQQRWKDEDAYKADLKNAVANADVKETETLGPSVQPLPSSIEHRVKSGHYIDQAPWIGKSPAELAAQGAMQSQSAQRLGPQGADMAAQGLSMLDKGGESSQVGQAVKMAAGGLGKGYKVGDRAFNSRDAAEAYTKAYNAEPARNQRIADVMMQHDPVKGMSFRKDAAQTQEVEQAMADRTFDRNLRDALAKGPEALAELMNSGGGQKFQSIQNKDGTWGIAALDQEGNATALPYRFTPDEQGMALAGFMLSRAVTPEQRVAHFRRVEESKQEQANSDRDFALREKQVNASMAEDRRRTSISAGHLALNRQQYEDSKRVAQQGEGIAPFDIKTATAIATDQVKKEAENAAASGAPMSARDIARRHDEIIKGFWGQYNDNVIDMSASRDLSQVRNDPAKYAAKYQQALSLGVTPERLKALGFAPPGSDKQSIAESIKNGEKSLPPISEDLFGAQEAARINAAASTEQKKMAEIEAQKRQEQKEKQEKLSVARTQLEGLTDTSAKYLNAEQVKKLRNDPVLWQAMTGEQRRAVTRRATDLNAY